MTPETGFLARLAEEQRAHSIFAPSSAAMWSRCSGSLIPNVLAIDNGSAEAAEGTVAHTMADLWLKSGERPTSWVGKILECDGFLVPVDDAMLAYVEEYVDWVQECTGEMYFEQRVDLSSLFPIPNQGGTADHFSCSFGKLTITDLKYGKGVQVYAKDNEQGLLYAYGVFLGWDWYYGFQTIEIRICQPRLDHFDTWTIDRSALLAFGEHIKGRAALAWRLDAPRTPGEKQCQWCKVKADCPAILAWIENQADGTFEDLDMAEAAERADDTLSEQHVLPVISTPGLTIAAKVRIWKARGMIESWIKAIEADLFAAALEGEAPGLKIVDGRSNRAWIDPEAARKRMIEVGIEKPVNEKLFSPNQAEEWLHADRGMTKRKAQALLESHTMRSDGVRTLVDANDKRPALLPEGDVFEDLDTRNGGDL